MRLPSEGLLADWQHHMVRKLGRASSLGGRPAAVDVEHEAEFLVNGRLSTNNVDLVQDEQRFS
jgi:hypothetical protein